MSDALLEAMTRAGWDGEDKDQDRKMPDSRDPDKDNLHELKVKAETKRIDIQNAVSLHHLISRKLTTSMLEVLGQEIKINFVDLPRRVSMHMASMAKNPGIEREFEKYLAEYISKGIVSMKGRIETMCQDGFFDDILDEI